MTIFEKIRAFFMPRKKRKAVVDLNMGQILALQAEEGRKLYRKAKKGQEAATLAEEEERLCELEKAVKIWKTLPSRELTHDQLVATSSPLPFSKLCSDIKEYDYLPWYKKWFVSPAKRKEIKRKKELYLYHITKCYTNPKLTKTSKPVFAGNKNRHKNFFSFLKGLFQKSRTYSGCWSTFEKADQGRLKHHNAEEKKVADASLKSSLDSSFSKLHSLYDGVIEKNEEVIALSDKTIENYKTVIKTAGEAIDLRKQAKKKFGKAKTILTEVVETAERTAILATQLQEQLERKPSRRPVFGRSRDAAEPSLLDDPQIKVNELNGIEATLAYVEALGMSTPERIKAARESNEAKAREAGLQRLGPYTYAQADHLGRVSIFSHQTGPTSSDSNSYIINIERCGVGPRST